MSHPPATEQVPPWYRQFWPWFLMGLPACAVLASLWTLYIAHSGSDDLVVDDYYRDGLAINRQLEKRHFAEQTGIGAELLLRGRDIVVTLSGPVSPRELRLRLSHPLEADRDFEVSLMQASRDRYRARLPQMPGRRWHWILDTGSSSAWRLDGSLDAANFQDAGQP
jgi:hypothetical protein